jgi:hypothetical protein
LWRTITFAKETWRVKKCYLMALFGGVSSSSYATR